MNSRTLEIIANELSAELSGRRFGRVFQLGRGRFAFDLRLNGSRYLLADVQPADPAVFLVTRRLRDIEKASGNMSPFALSLRKYLSGAEIMSLMKLSEERVLEMELTGEDEFGSVTAKRLIFQLTGRSANLFLTDGGHLILDRARDTQGEGQQIGERYSPPARPASSPRVPERETPADEAVRAAATSPSEALDAFYAERDAEQHFRSVARAAEAKIAADVRKREKLIANLHGDLAAHGDADRWKRFGDLLLSNVSSARRDGGSIYVTDYFDESLPEVAIEADENDSVTETAEKYFRRYAKARNAAAEISARLNRLKAEVEQLQCRKADITQAIGNGDVEFLERIAGKKEPAAPKEIKKAAEAGGVARRFISSDGFEILVGKRAKDNDVLTFKIAKSLDTWMHAADYPGSHVVVRNPNRAEIPQRTMHEAAQLAAFYSQGKSQVKAAVHYTQKKFVNKPKGAAPGLVSLASFKTLLVAPEFPDGIAKPD